MNYLRQSSTHSMVAEHTWDKANDSHVYLVPIGKSVTKGLGIDLRARVVAHRIAMDDLQDLHSDTTCASAVFSSSRKSLISRVSPSRSVTCGDAIKGLITLLSVQRSLLHILILSVNLAHRNKGHNGNECHDNQ